MGLAGETLGSIYANAPSQSAEQAEKPETNIKSISAFKSDFSKSILK